jgi:hypothetical protein
MIVLAEPTDEIVLLDGVECRAWRGVTETGTSCVLYVHRVQVRAGPGEKEFEQELLTKPEPRAQPGLMNIPEDGKANSSCPPC